MAGESKLELDVRRVREGMWGGDRKRGCTVGRHTDLLNTPVTCQAHFCLRTLALAVPSAQNTAPRFLYGFLSLQGCPQGIGAPQLQVLFCCVRNTSFVCPSEATVNVPHGGSCLVPCTATVLASSAIRPGAGQAFPWAAGQPTAAVDATRSRKAEHVVRGWRCGPGTPPLPFEVFHSEPRSGRAAVSPRISCCSLCLGLTSVSPKGVSQWCLWNSGLEAP